MIPLRLKKCQTHVNITFGNDDNRSPIIELYLFRGSLIAIDVIVIVVVVVVDDDDIGAVNVASVILHLDISDITRASSSSNMYMVVTMRRQWKIERTNESIKVI
jgi:hypothetical protein